MNRYEEFIQNSPMLGEFLSHSRAYLYNKCRKAFQYKYLEKVRPLPATMWLDSWERMTRGILIHSGMEAGFLGKDLATHMTEANAERERKYGSLSVEQQALFPGMMADSLAVAQSALDWLPISDWEAPIGPNGKPMVEYELKLPLPGWKGFVGYADLVARYRPTGALYVVDYKARASFEREDMDKYNSQFALYQKALSEIGVPVVGSILFEIKPTPPARAPRLTRVDAGGLTGVRISTDGRFRLTPTLRSQEMVNNYWEDFKVQATAIAQATPETSYRSMNGFNCGSCEFEKLCMGDLRGDDVESILTRHYSVPRESLRVVEEL